MGPVVHTIRFEYVVHRDILVRDLSQDPCRQQMRAELDRQKLEVLAVGEFN
jgi:hypothetical protein